MKKVFVLLLMVLMVASIAFANGDGESKKIELAATTGGMSADSPAGKGMALFAQKVAEYSNGTIEISSAPGRGTKVTITIAEEE